MTSQKVVSPLKGGKTSDTIKRVLTQRGGKFFDLEKKED